MRHDIDLPEALYRWLGIPLREQPPNHYRLLGLALFEHDPGVIEAAADRQMAHVRSYSTGPHSAVSQELLNSLSAARVCLLDEFRKAEYDASLQMPPMDAAPAALPVLRRQAKPSALSKPLLWVGTGVVGALLFFLIASQVIRTAFHQDVRKQDAAAIEPEAIAAAPVNATPSTEEQPVAEPAVEVPAPAFTPLLTAEISAQKSVVVSSSPPLAISPFDGIQAKRLQEQWAKHLKRSVIETNSIGMKLALIPPGEFTMGQTDGNPSERPVHRVRITRAFYLGIHEVTQAEYRAVTENSPSYFKGDERPVEMVSALDADEFCRLLTERERRAGSLPQSASYRLPTEAEWEYAARAGTTTRWCCGDDEQQLGQYAWYRQDSGNQTHPVGLKQPNAFGLHDTYGNVWEWCSDWYDENYYATSPGDDPQGPAAGVSRVLRGGGWSYDGVHCRSARRHHPGGPGRRVSIIGFRVVLAMAKADSQIVAAETSDQKLAAASSPSPPPSPAIAPFNAQQAKQYQEQWAKHLHRSVVETNSIGMKLALIPAGEFMMGQSDGDSDERPVHRVRITRAFCLGTHEVTQSEYRAVTGNSPSHFKGDDLPVEAVSVGEADEFCRLLTERERSTGSLPKGSIYRLPTEAEWEYSARAGTTTKWCCGDDEQRLGEYAWYSQTLVGQTHPVGQKQPNAWGLFDMHGNVMEFCSDWYDENYYNNSPPNDSGGPAARRENRVHRGGDWYGDAQDCRSANRQSGQGLSQRSYRMGFRVVLATVDAESQIVAAPPPPASKSATNALTIEVQLHTTGKGTLILDSRQNAGEKEEPLGVRLPRRPPNLQDADVYQLEDGRYRIVHDFRKISGDLPWVDKREIILEGGYIVFQRFSENGRQESKMVYPRQLQLPLRLSFALASVPHGTTNLRLHTSVGMLSLDVVGSAEREFSLAWHPGLKEKDPAKSLLRDTRPASDRKEWNFEVPALEKQRQTVKAAIFQSYESDNARLRISKMEATAKLVGMIGLSVDFQSGRSVVRYMLPGFPGERAGLAVGDVIASVNGKTVSNMQAWQSATSNMEIGDELTLQVVRQGKRKRIKIVAE